MAQRFRFRRDTAVWTPKDTEISLMILQESATGMRQTYLARAKFEGDSHYSYALVNWDGNAGQFTANSSFAGGFTGAALLYVARWHKRIPAQAKRALA
jgi:hypothetical protein